MRKTSAEGWWMVQMTGRPILATRCSARIVTLASCDVSPDVGSSANSKLGMAASSTAMVRRLVSSNESPATDMT